MSCLHFINLSGKKDSGLLFTSGQDARGQRLPGRMRTLLRSRASRSRHMKTKEDVNWVEAGCGSLSFCVSILDHLCGIMRVDAISTLL